MFSFVLAAGDGSRAAVSLFREIQSHAAAGGAGVSNTGNIIASIFLLLVVFRGIIIILEGGKFQIRLLGPILIYLAACNFSIVSRPVTMFVSGIQGGMAVGIHEGRQSASGGKTRWQQMVDSWETNTEEQSKKLENRLNNLLKVEVEENTDDGAAQSSDGTSTDNKPHKKILGLDLTQFGENIKESLRQWWNETKENLVNSIVEFDKFNKNSYTSKVISLGLPFILAVILDWFVTVMAFVMTSMGSILANVFLAFGPLTWAFAVLPGNAGVIKSWFLRLCQFALYSPLCGMVGYYNDVIMNTSMAGQGGMALAGSIAILICNLMLLTAIPSIASQIIEGATSGMSVSQAFHTLMSPVQMGTSIINLGEASRDTKQMNVSKESLDTLKEISKKLGNGPTIP